MSSAPASTSAKWYQRALAGVSRAFTSSNTTSHVQHAWFGTTPKQPAAYHNVAQLGGCANAFVSQLWLVDTYGKLVHNNTPNASVVAPLSLGAGEYIARLEAAVHEGRIQFLSLSTNTGKLFEAGSTTSSAEHIVLENMRVLQMAVAIDNDGTLQGLGVAFLADYAPAAVLEHQLTAITGIVAAGAPQSAALYVRGRDRKRATALRLCRCFANSAAHDEGMLEFVAEACQSARVAVSSMSVAALETSLSAALRNRKHAVNPVPEGFIGVYMAQGTLLQSVQDTGPWFDQAGGEVLSIVPVQCIELFMGMYDLTQALAFHLPELESHQSQRHGWPIFLADSSSSGAP